MPSDGAVAYSVAIQLARDGPIIDAQIHRVRLGKIQGHLRPVKTAVRFLRLGRVVLPPAIPRSQVSGLSRLETQRCQLVQVEGRAGEDFLQFFQRARKLRRVVKGRPVLGVMHVDHP
jgi:hypothetical protein